MVGCTFHKFFNQDGPLYAVLTIYHKEDGGPSHCHGGWQAYLRLFRMSFTVDYTR